LAYKASSKFGKAHLYAVLTGFVDPDLLRTMIGLGCADPQHVEDHMSIPVVMLEWTGEAET